LTDKSKIIPDTPTATEYNQGAEKELSWTQAKDPISLFEEWLAKAGETEINDPNAMSSNYKMEKPRFAFIGKHKKDKYAFVGMFYP